LAAAEGLGTESTEESRVFWAGEEGSEIELKGTDRSGCETVGAGDVAASRARADGVSSADGGSDERETGARVGMICAWVLPSFSVMDGELSVTVDADEVEAAEAGDGSGSISRQVCSHSVHFQLLDLCDSRDDLVSLPTRCTDRSEAKGRRRRKPTT
jgi:hypothetical protein